MIQEPNVLDISRIAQIVVPVEEQPEYIDDYVGWKTAYSAEDDFSIDVENVCQSILENREQPFGWAYADGTNDCFILSGITFKVTDVEVRYKVIQKRETFVWIISLIVA